jgi:hypothetical protein
LMPDNVNSLSLGQRTSGSKKPLCLSSKGGLKIKHLLTSLQIFASFFFACAPRKSGCKSKCFFLPLQILASLFFEPGCLPLPRSPHLRLQR